mmetsp:Transcript_17650/g.40705  ORF Transcript_17650/g.40705 Transcript_17650/m.40705 type:complete len:944 (-) Transcript_17650:137-2968(-)
MGAPAFPPVGPSSSRPPQPHNHSDQGVGAINNNRRNDAIIHDEVDKQKLAVTYTSLIQEYLQVMCLDNATFLAERMVASCQTTNAYYLLGVCHYRSGAPQRALSVLATNIHQSSNVGGGTKYHNSATAYLMAKCCFDLQQYGRAEETLLETARADYKEYKNVNRIQGNNFTNKDGNTPMEMDEWLVQTSPCPIPNGAAGLNLLGNICRRSNRRRRAMDYYRMSLQLDPLMWVSYEALCEMGAVDIDPTSVFGVRPVQLDDLQQHNLYHSGEEKEEAMPLQEKPIHVTPHHKFTPPISMGAGSTRPMDVVRTPTSIGPKASLFQTIQRPSLKNGVEMGGPGVILPNQLQFDTPNLTPISMQQDASFAHPNSAASLHHRKDNPTSDNFFDSRNSQTIQRAKHVAARLYYQPTPETPKYSELITAPSLHHEEESRYNNRRSAGADAVSSARRYLRGKSALWSSSLVESSTISETPLRRGGGGCSDISTTRRPRALFLSEKRSAKTLRNATNNDADANHEDQLHVEDEENHNHRSMNGRPPLSQHEAEPIDIPEQRNTMMTTEENGDRLPSFLVGNLKPQIRSVVADNCVSDEELNQALEEDAMMEKHDGSIQRILELFCLMGAGYWRLCQFHCRESLRLFGSLPRIHHNTGWVLNQEGRAYFEMAEYQNAQRCLEMMQTVEPHRMKGLELLSTVLWQLKKEVELAHLAQKVVDFDRLSPEAWCVVGNCFSLQKEHETALVFFGRSLQLDSSFTYTHTLSGYEYMANEDFEKAMACFRNGIRLDERHYNAWYGMGAIYHRQEKYDLAEYHFQRAVKINPQSSVLRCNLGMSQYSNGKPIEALDTLAEAFRLDPHNPQARFQRATIYVALNRSEEALKELEKVRDAAPREATVHFAMGKVLKRLGRPEQAMRCFLTALDLDPKDNQLIKSAMDKLEEPDVIDEEVTAF